MSFILKQTLQLLAGNILSEVDRSINNLIYIIKFLREILVVTVIFILLLISDPIITISLSIIFSLAVGLFFMFVRKSFEFLG